MQNQTIKAGSLTFLFFLFSTFAKPQFFVGTACQARLFSDSIHSTFIKSTITTNFSIVTLTNDLKWNNWDKDNQYFSKSYRDSAMTWLHDNQIEIKGHHLIWGPLIKETHFQKGRESDYLDRFLEHSYKKLNDTKQYIQVWDFINHPVKLGSYSTYFDELYFESIKTFYDSVRKIDKDYTLYINEGGILSKVNHKKRQKYIEKIQEYLSNGIQLDGIGFMGHFHDIEGEVDTTYIKETLDMFSEFDLPITITEFDYRFYSRGSREKLNDSQLKRQATNTKLLLNLFYDHPAVNGVILWGFWEKYHWYPTAAFWDADMAIKPNGVELIKFLEEKGLLP